MASAASDEGMLYGEGIGSGPAPSSPSAKASPMVKELDGYVVDLDLKGEVIVLRLVHRDTLRTFEGEFAKPDLTKLHFHQHSSVEADMKTVQDAFLGTYPDTTLEIGFVNEATDDIVPIFFRGASLLVNIKEVYKREILSYKFLLPNTDTDDLELQTKVNAALRSEIAALAALVAGGVQSAPPGPIAALPPPMAVSMPDEVKVDAASSEEIEAVREELREMREEHKREMLEMVEANEMMKGMLTGRTVSFFERITAPKKRVAGKWTRLVLNCGKFGNALADRCSFATLKEDGSIVINADGDYEFQADCSFGFCSAFGMQLVVRDIDASARVLDAVGCGYHSASNNTQTSVCRVSPIWIPVETGSTVAMRVYVGHSSPENTYTDSALCSQMEDGCMPVASVTIRKLC